MNNKQLLEKYDELDLLKLPELVKKNKFEYKLIKRVKDKCIYEKQSSINVNSYIVFKTKIYRYRDQMLRFLKLADEDSKKYQEYKESFPVSEEFGRRAWYYTNINDAEIKYNSL